MKPNIISTEYGDCNPVNLDNVLSIRGTTYGRNFMIHFHFVAKFTESWELPLDEGAKIYKSIIVHFTTQLK